MVSLAMPDVGWSWPVMLAWTPLLVVLRGESQLSWKRRFALGWLMGFGYQAITFRWVHWTMSEMTNLPSAVTISGMVVFWLWHGLNCALFVALSEPIRRESERRFIGSGPVALGVLWVSVEWAFPYIFPWTLGHAFWDVPSVASIQALAGAPGISFVILVLSGFGAELWHRRSQRYDRAHARKAHLWVASTTLPLILFGLLWAQAIERRPPQQTVRVGIVQPNFTIEEKKNPVLKVRLKLFERLLALLATIEPGQYDLVVGSEGSFPLFWELERDSTATKGVDAWGYRRLRDTLERHVATPVILGGLRRDLEGKSRNTAVLLDERGEIRGHYDKTILVPFSEYLPGRDWFPQLQNSVRGISNFYPGESACRFEAAGQIIACGICYEHTFAQFGRESAADSTLAVNLTIDTWFGDGPAPWFHLMLHSSRAVELGTPLIRAALTGVSAVVDVNGQVLGELGLHQRGVLAVDVPVRRMTPPYRVVGPIFLYACLLLTVGLVGLTWRRKRTV